MEDSEIIGKEFRFGFHLSAIPDVRRDTHVVKEVIHYKDGTSKPHLRIIENFKRPFWITKEHYQKHKDKKECELLDRVIQYTATESGLARAVLTRLGSRYNGKKTLRDALPSPYIYGLDVSGLTMMKYYYSKKYPDYNTPYTMCALDTEVDIDTGELLILTVCTTDNIYVTILDRMVENRNNPEEQLKYLYDKYIPDCDLKEKINVTFDICTDELQMVVNAFKKVHEWQPDFLAIWNISYDMEVLLKVLEKSEVDPKDIFSDPSLPPELREFKFVKGQIQKVTESGVLKPLEPREQWHTVKCPASFYWIDAMSAYHFVRVGTKNVPGGYSLDNILTTELGEGYKKLKFKDEVAEYLDGPDWHKYMVAKRPLEYVIYNCWDVMSMLELDKKTNDLAVSMPLLSGPSDFSIFNSGPKKLVNELHFFYLDNGLVLGTKGIENDDDKILGLDSWIVLLSNYYVGAEDGEYIEEDANARIDRIANNIRGFVYDADQSSGYPSDTLTANVSKDTTMREIVTIGDIDKDDFKLNNINLIFGKVNHVDYVTSMMNFPTLQTLADMVRKEKVS